MENIQSNYAIYEYAYIRYENVSGENIIIGLVMSCHERQHFSFAMTEDFSRVQGAFNVSDNMIDLIRESVEGVIRGIEKKVKGGFSLKTLTNSAFHYMSSIQFSKVFSIVVSEKSEKDGFVINAKLMLDSAIGAYSHKTETTPQKATQPE